ncbi:hypothetical protein [Egicoccus sp. AB-alg2]|uniref:hypothetical protein n=1 Tax=Egicoccus sp. AB-alg2 TaxID=3242693 RepID=UPI00359E5AB2
MNPTRTAFTAPIMGNGAVAPELLRARLDDLAARVAADLERGAVDAAWRHTRGIEHEADPTSTIAEPVPPAPVIGRRFAAAHRRLLRLAHGAVTPEADGTRRHPAA